MDTKDVLADAYGRIRELVAASLDGIDDAGLIQRVEADANTIAWLVWHLTRIQDDHVAEIAGRQQAWIDDGWAERFGMEPDPHNTGFGHTTEQVGAVVAPVDVLAGYHQTVADRTAEYLETITSDELDRIIDYRWDPPVTVGVRLVSVISDNLQHAGQARYVRGIVDRMG